MTTDRPLCRCPGSCELHEGICEHPVENPFEVEVFDHHGARIKYPYGLCEKCLNALEAHGKIPQKQQS